MHTMTNRRKYIARANTHYHIIIHSRETAKRMCKIKLFNCYVYFWKYCKFSRASDILQIKWI